MINDKRKGGAALPEPLYKLLNNEQMVSLKNLTEDGWEVCFVRRPMFGLRIIVLHKPGTEQFGLLGEDGVLDVDSELEMR